MISDWSVRMENGGHNAEQFFLPGLHNQSSVVFNLSKTVKSSHTKRQMYMMYPESKRNKYYLRYKTS